MAPDEHDQISKARRRYLMKALAVGSFGALAGCAVAVTVVTVAVTAVTVTVVTVAATADNRTSMR